MSRDEQQRICAHCQHPKRGHELPRTEGGHGGGTSGRCVVYSCGCRGFVPTEEFKDQEFVGDESWPAWVAEGVKVKVKSTPVVRKYGIKIGRGHGDYLWGGEVGTVERQDGIGWWTYLVRFSEGRSAHIDGEFLESVKPLKEKRP